MLQIHVGEACGIRVPLLGLDVLRFGTVLIHRSELVEQCFVADLEDFGGLTAIPARLKQNSFDIFSLRVHGCATTDIE